MTTQFLKIENLRKTYFTNDIATHVLNGINLEVKQGDFLAIMGPSGCGKSTLLQIMGLLDTPTMGDIFFLERNITHISERRRAVLRKENIGFIFQSFNLIDELTVFENIELPLVYLKINNKERKEQVQEVMQRLGISHKAQNFPQQLSGGQQQRTAIGRAIVARPKLILADEPTGNLDSRNSEEIMQLLTTLNRQYNTTLVMVTHSAYDAEYAHKVIHMFDGQIVSEKAGKKHMDFA